MTTLTLPQTFTPTHRKPRPSSEALEHQLAPRVAMIQDGARLHYAVPAALRRAGILEAMYADFYDSSWRDAIVRLGVWPFKPSLARAMAGRRCDDLRGVRIFQQGFKTLRHRLARRRFADDATYYQWAAQQTAQWLLRRGLGDANAAFGFVRNLDPQWLSVVHRAGVATAADQIIAPAAVERDRLQREMDRWPDWQFIDLAGYDRVETVERETWRHLDRITCGSNFVRDGLIAQGIDAARINVLPYPLDAAHYDVPNRKGRTGPVHVGFLGTVNLRKGAPYFIEVAKRFKPQQAQFIMVGPIALEDEATAACRASAQLTDRVPRRDIPAWLARFDLLLLPSVCEGNAGAVTEALAAGLPVVTTPGAGSIVRDGVDGYLCDEGDVDAMAARVHDLVADAGLRHAMSVDARRRAEQFSLDNYAADLAALFNHVLNP